MAQKFFTPMITIPGSNEQTGAGQTTQTASGVSREYGLFGGAARALFLMDVSAMSGTGSPTLTVFIEASDYATGKWRTVVSFPAQTAVTGSTPIADIAVDPLYYQVLRTRWTITGTTPSFTFTVGAIIMNEEPAS